MDRKISSEELFIQAKQYLPGGVNSPVRSFQSVGGVPRFIKSAQGAYLTDVSEQRYIDYVGSWGPMILGHAHPEVILAVKQAAEAGLSFGAPCENEIKLAKKVCSLVPSIEKIRMMNSGTEAVMAAIRLARATTGRDKIIKFEGCYHGCSDSVLVKAGSGALTLGVPSSPGVAKAAAEDTLTASYNHLESLEPLLAKHKGEVAAILVEPIAGNMNMIMPVKGFLQGLRELCDRYGALLIFDEVMTGFRVHLGGAQALYGIRPDLTVLGKVIGGGMPVGAVGGPCDLMDQLAPQGAVYQAGTLSGNPIAMAAGLATLNQLDHTVYEKLHRTGGQLIKGLIERASQAGVALTGCYQAGMFGFSFSEQPVIDFVTVMECNKIKFKRFFHVMLQNGIYLAPSAFETGFISLAHGAIEVEKTLKAAEVAFSQLND